MSTFLLRISRWVVHAPFFGELGTIRSNASYKPYLTLGERLTANPSALRASSSTEGGGCWGNDPVDGKPRPSKKDKSKSKPKKQSNKKKTKRKSKTALCERLDEDVDSYCGNKFADVNSCVVDPCGTKADVSDKTVSADCKVDGKDSYATNSSVSKNEPKEEVSKEKTTDVKLHEKAVCAEVCNKKSADSKMDVCYTQSADSVCDQKSTDTKVVCKHRSDDSKVDTCYTQSADPCACDKNSSESTKVKDSNKKTSDSKIEDSNKNPDDSTVNCCYQKGDEGRKDSKQLKSSANEEPCSCTKVIASAVKESNEIPSPLLFRKMKEGDLGPDISKSGTYQNPEYFSYTKWSFYDAMIGLARVSCPQPSNKIKSKA